MSLMTIAEAAVLTGRLKAHDTGDVSAGVRDDNEKTQLFERFKSDPDFLTDVLTVWARTTLSDPAYGIEDIASMMHWVEVNGLYDFY